MTSLALWVLGIAFFVFFRQELSNYFSRFKNRPYITVMLLLAFISYFSINTYFQFHSFLVIVIYQIDSLKVWFSKWVLFHISPFLIVYLFHLILIMMLLFAYLYYESKHKSIIYQEQVILLRQFIYVIFLIVILVCSYSYDLSIFTN